ncbi:hypothetical protein Vretifemale_18586 [Volvox reticuliferus]|uniref:TRP C-terminal domain-containing protein n=2 Tax=Volvox reticuliferus TaxID=1737510 RepID=A0A8J4FVL3_9CHLO|nr:hypothetical protein Vretifemale_18586 [Volvox reticuliferus]
MAEAALNGPATKRALIVHLKFSEPVTGFDPWVALRPTGAVIVEWVASPDNSSFWLLALATFLLRKPAKTSVGMATSASASASIAPAVGLAKFHLPASAYFDRARNLGVNDLELEMPPVEGHQSFNPAVVAALEKVTIAAAVLYPATVSVTAMAVATSAYFAQIALLGGGGLMHSCFHLQVLAMSLYAASSGVGSDFARMALKLRYAVLGIKGNLGVLDQRVLPRSVRKMSAGDQARLAAGDLWPLDERTISSTTLGKNVSTTVDTAATIIMDTNATSPTTNTTTNTTATDALTVSSSETPPLQNRRPTASKPTDSPTTPSFADPEVAIVAPAAHLAGEYANPGRATRVGSEGPGFLGAAARRPRASPVASTATPLKSKAAAAADRRRSTQAVLGEGPPPPPSRTPPPLQSPPLPPPPRLEIQNLYNSTDTQSLLYSMSIAFIIMSAVFVLRLAVTLLHRWFRRAGDLHPHLAFPRHEMAVTGVLLIALTFYSGLALGEPKAGWVIGGGAADAAVCRKMAHVVLWLLVVPYGGFLWWLGLSRACMTPQFVTVKPWEHTWALREAGVQNTADGPAGAEDSSTPRTGLETEHMPRSPPPPSHSDRIPSTIQFPQLQQEPQLLPLPPLSQPLESDPRVAVTSAEDLGQSILANGPHLIRPELRGPGSFWSEQERKLQVGMPRENLSTRHHSAVHLPPLPPSARQCNAAAAGAIADTAAAERFFGPQWRLWWNMSSADSDSDEGRDGGGAVSDGGGEVSVASSHLYKTFSSAVLQAAMARRNESSAAAMGSGLRITPSTVTTTTTTAAIKGPRQHDRTSSGRRRKNSQDAELSAGAASVSNAAADGALLQPSASTGVHADWPQLRGSGGDNSLTPPQLQDTEVTTAAVTHITDSVGSGGRHTCRSREAYSTSSILSPGTLTDIRSRALSADSSIAGAPSAQSYGSRAPHPRHLVFPGGEDISLGGFPSSYSTVYKAVLGHEMGAGACAAAPLPGLSLPAEGNHCCVRDVMTDSSHGGGGDRASRMFRAPSLQSRHVQDGRGVAVYEVEGYKATAAEASRSRMHTGLGPMAPRLMGHYGPRCAGEQRECQGLCQKAVTTLEADGSGRWLGKVCGGGGDCAPGRWQRPPAVMGYRYRSGCWAPWLLSSASLMTRFEFVFEDVLGVTPAAKLLRAGTPLRVLAPALHFTHKACCAALLGYFGLRAESIGQLGAVIALQGVMLMYLIAVQPYLEWHLQTLEIACNAAELGMFVVSLTVVNATYSKAATVCVMAFFFFGLVCILLYELLRAYRVLRNIWRPVRELLMFRWRRRWWQPQHPDEDNTARKLLHKLASCCKREESGARTLKRSTQQVII